jgi:hypothetical protein
MKRLSTLAALSAVVVAGFIGTSAQAQQLSGSILLEDSGVRDIPLGTNEIGRFGRFIMDERLSDLNFRNRDYEAWKPLDVQSKQMTRHFIMGKLQTEASPIPDQEIGRYVRVIEDDRLVRNNMEFNDRTFYGYKIPSPYTGEAQSVMGSSIVRGLATGTNLGSVRQRGVLVGGTPATLNFWQ